MIVRAVGGELWLFDQWDHSLLCGAMAEAWGAPPFADVPHAVRRAAATHDAGWREWDPLPRLDPATGRPHPYSRMPDDDYLEIWRRGLARGWAEGDEVGLLVSLHGMRFFGRRERPEDRRLHGAERERQKAALEGLGATPADDGLPDPIARWHAWLFFWDGLSLFLCEGWTSPWSTRLPDAAGGEVEVSARREGEEGPGGAVRLDPMPFREPLRLGLTARVIPDAGYADQAGLDRAVAAAERRRVEWRVAPGR